jgi:hypothetical protein
MDRLKEKRCGTILETKLKIDANMRSDSKLTENEYDSMRKCPIIYFNGPFEPCYGIQKRKDNYRLNKYICDILDEINRGAIVGQEARIIKSKRSFLGNIYSIESNSLLKKREEQYYREINKKLQKKIFNQGMDAQALVHQFHGEQDRFNVNIRQRNFFKRFKNDVFN